MNHNRRNFGDELRYIWQKKNILSRLIVLNAFIFAIISIIKVFTFLYGASDWYVSLIYYLSLPANISSFINQPWSLITYGFLHEGLFHIFFNMLILYWFGRLLIDFLGNKHVRNLYILGIIVAGLFYIMIYNVVPYYEEIADKTILLGASGAVYAVVVAAATLLPDYSLYLIFLGPVRIIKYIALAYIFVSFIGIVGSNSGGALAHLGGALLGYLYIKYKHQGINLGAPVDAFFDLFDSKPKVRKTHRRSGTSQVPKRSNKNKQAEIDKILDKISESGYDSLTREEKEKLFRMSGKK